MIKILQKITAAIFIRGAKIFGNISEGTHAGAITMRAEEDIPCANLVVKYGSTEGEFKIAAAGERPIGICTDEGATGDRLSVILAGCSESTAICIAASSVSAGDVLYGAASGKVSTTPADGAFKIGVALCDAATGGVVEVDMQGFGERVWQFHSAGVFTWNGGAATTAELPVSGLIASDIVIANIVAAAGSEKLVSALVDEDGDKINFTLDSNGTNSTTKISWIAVSKK